MISRMDEYLELSQRAADAWKELDVACKGLDNALVIEKAKLYEIAVHDKTDLYQELFGGKQE